MARKTIESIIAVAVTLGGIFGLIVDAPDVLALAIKVFTAPFAWIGQMNGDLGYWILIVGGIVSLAWIHLGDKFGPRWWDRLARRSTPLPVPASELSDAVRRELASIATAVAEKTSFEDVRQLIQQSDTIQALKAERAMVTREPKQDTVAALNARLDAVDRDLLGLFDYCTHNLRFQMLTLLQQQAPRDIASHFKKEEITEKWVLDQTRMALEYVDHVRVTLSGTYLGDEVQTAIERGKLQAETRISSLSADERPTHIDPYKFLQYGVARFQYEEVMTVLRGTMLEDEKKLKSYLLQLRNRLQERNTKA
jgi:hypothetical protein